MLRKKRVGDPPMPHLESQRRDRVRARPRGISPLAPSTAIDLARTFRRATPQLRRVGRQLARQIDVSGREQRRETARDSRRARRPPTDGSPVIVINVGTTPTGTRRVSRRARRPQRATERFLDAPRGRRLID